MVVRERQALSRNGLAMLDLIESLSLKSGALVVAMASVVLAAGSAQVRSSQVRWVLALIGPLLVPYSLYWSPVWLGASSLEYQVWARPSSSPHGACPA